MKHIDLHLHTTASDGVHSPAKILELVRKANLAAFSVTDHDTLDGSLKVRELLQPEDPELISGVELSVSVEGDDMHMLAYLFDPAHESFCEQLRLFKIKREQRGMLIVEKLQQMGVSITFEDVKRVAGNSVIGRPHIAEALLKLRHISAIEEAFRKYIGYESPAYVPKAAWSPKEAIDMIHSAGGLAVMAHPGIANMTKHIPKMATLGMDGIEVFHYAHNRETITMLKKVAEAYSLLMTGGSDFHGRSVREGSVGSQKVPAELLDQLKARVVNLRQAI